MHLKTGVKATMNPTSDLNLTPPSARRRRPGGGLHRANALPSVGVWAFLCALLATTSAYAQTNVVTHHYDNARTGANTNETILTPSNVNFTSFGKLFSKTVDGQVYAQPLYMPGLTMGAGTPQAGTTHNVVFIATEHDSVYAFDADNNAGQNANPLWQASLLDAAHGAAAGATTMPNGDVNTTDINPEIGITGTPTIDPSTNTLYVVGKTKEGITYVQRLHALDLTTGAEKFNGPMTLAAAVAGTGTGSSAGTLNFDPKWENQRPGLLLQNGIVYIGFASHGDNGPWHGWILAYNASTLAQTGAWCTSPNGSTAGIWMSGSGLAADVPDPVNHPYGRMFIATGNGGFNALSPYTNSMNYGDSHVRLDLTNGVPTVQDDFTPYNQAAMNGVDGDLGSGGLLVIPDQTTGGHTHLLAQAGKSGTIYLVDRDSMSGYNGTTDNNVQDLVGALPGGIWAMPTFWNGNLYYWGSGDNLKSYSLTNGLLSTSPTALSSESIGFQGSTPVVSSNGTTNGIVWNIEGTGGRMVLFAHNALNVSQTLYSSQQDASRDAGGSGIKFTVPVVINGKVYVGDSGQFEVYGLLNGAQQAATPVINPASSRFAASIQISITDSTPASTIYYTTDGTTPTTSSSQYTGPLTLTTTTTVQAIAAATGFLQSPVATDTFTQQTQATAPTFNPAPTTYTTPQSVTLASTTPGASIYYTVDGSTPSPGVGTTKLYSGPIFVSSTTFINAIATASGLNNSPLSSGTFTVSLGGVTSINLSGGFSGGGMTLNGNAAINGTRLRLTDGGVNETSSAWYSLDAVVQTFSTSFSFQITPGTTKPGDGFTFTIQANSTTAIGGEAGSLGYGPGSTIPGIDSSMAIKFDTFNGTGNSTGIYLNGVAPTTPFVDLTGTGINLQSGDTFNVQMNYNSTILTMTITDTVTAATYTTAFPVDIPGNIGGTSALIGFTASTDTNTATQDILNWTFNYSGPPTDAPTFSPAGGTYLGSQTVTISDTTPGSAIYYTTDGTTPTTSSTPYTAPVSVTTSQTINAIAAAPNYIIGGTGAAGYVIESQVATPVITPAAGTYAGAQTVTISDTTPGATVHYTTDSTTPTSSSSLYTAPLTVASNLTFKAIATASGYFDSAVASAAYSITAPPPAAIPAFNPPGSTITSTQAITLSDATTGSTIYYTTDGSAPSPGSGTTQEYSAPFSLSASATVNAVAVASGYGLSAVGTAIYTVQAVPPSVNFSAGFPSATGLTLNGGTTVVPNRLRLTDGGASEARSAFFSTPVNIQTFTNDFSFQLTNPAGDGITFTIQADSAPTRVGPAGSSLGYGAPAPGGASGIPLSIAVKFDDYNNSGEGNDSTGLYTNGASPTIPAIDMTSSGVRLQSGDVFNVHMTYDGTTLAWTLTDATTGKSFSTATPVNLLSILESPTAYVGFTGATGGTVSTQDILNWTFSGNAVSGVALPVRFETESLPGTSSGPAYQVLSWAGFTDSTGTILQASAAGANVTINLNVPAAGTYDVRVGVKRTSIRGTMQLSINGTSVGSPVDEYSNVGDSWNEFDLGNATLAAGNQPFKFTVTGKNAASTDFPVAFDYITLVPVGPAAPQAATPAFSPAGGTYAGAQTVTITDATAGAVIYYTTNGATPTTASSVYSTPITVSSTESVKAIAVLTGFSNSLVGSATYTLNLPLAATPAFSPAGGTYASAQPVTITDATAGAVIYYTTNGATPTTASPVYGAPIAVSTTETINAMAAATGFGNSNVASSTYTILNGTPSLNYAGGFTTATGLTLNGGATIVSNRLRLTDGGKSEFRSVFSSTPVNIQTFTNDFSFQFTNPLGEGLTFTIQGTSSPTRIGPNGPGLGYGAQQPGGAAGIPLSIAVKFDNFNNNGEGNDSTGLYTNGASPTIPATDMTSSGINLRSNDVFNVHMTYDGTTLAWAITDATTGKSFSTSAPLNLVSVIESPTAYVGFTSGTGGVTETADILGWTYSGTPVAGVSLPIRYETESIPGASSGPPYQVFTWTGFTDNSGTILQATKVGDNVTVNLNVPLSGVYDVRVGSKNAANRGMMQLSVNGANVGTAMDEYAKSESWREFDLGTVTLTSGSEPFKFTVTGKNASSTAYPISFDYITLIPQ